MEPNLGRTMDDVTEITDSPVLHSLPVDQDQTAITATNYLSQPNTREQLNISCLQTQHTTNNEKNDEQIKMPNALSTMKIESPQNLSFPCNQGFDHDSNMQAFPFNDGINSSYCSKYEKMFASDFNQNINAPMYTEGDEHQVQYVFLSQDIRPSNESSCNTADLSKSCCDAPSLRERNTNWSKKKKDKGGEGQANENSERKGKKKSKKKEKGKQQMDGVDTVEQSEEESFGETLIEKKGKKHESSDKDGTDTQEERKRKKKSTKKGKNKEKGEYVATDMLEDNEKAQPAKGGLKKKKSKTKEQNVEHLEESDQEKELDEDLSRGDTNEERSKKKSKRKKSDVNGTDNTVERKSRKKGKNERIDEDDTESPVENAETTQQRKKSTGKKKSKKKRKSEKQIDFHKIEADDENEEAKFSKDEDIEEENRIRNDSLRNLLVINSENLTSAEDNQDITDDKTPNNESQEEQVTSSFPFATDETSLEDAQAVGGALSPPRSVHWSGEAAHIPSDPHMEHFDPTEEGGRGGFKPVAGRRATMSSVRSQDLGNLQDLMQQEELDPYASFRMSQAQAFEQARQQPNFWGAGEMRPADGVPLPVQRSSLTNRQNIGYQSMDLRGSNLEFHEEPMTQNRQINVQPMTMKNVANQERFINRLQNQKWRQDRRSLASLNGVSRHNIESRHQLTMHDIASQEMLPPPRRVTSSRPAHKQISEIHPDDINQEALMNGARAILQQCRKVENAYRTANEMLLHTEKGQRPEKTTSFVNSLRQYVCSKLCPEFEAYTKSHAFQADVKSEPIQSQNDQHGHPLRQYVCSKFCPDFEEHTKSQACQTILQSEPIQHQGDQFAYPQDRIECSTTRRYSSQPLQNHPQNASCPPFPSMQEIIYAYECHRARCGPAPRPPAPCIQLPVPQSWRCVACMSLYLVLFMLGLVWVL